MVSFGNIEVSLFLVQPGQTTLPIAILQYLEWKIDPTVAAVSALQIAVVAAALLVTDRFVSLAKAVWDGSSLRANGSGPKWPAR